MKYFGKKNSIVIDCIVQQPVSYFSFYMNKKTVYKNYIFKKCIINVFYNHSIFNHPTNQVAFVPEKKTPFSLHNF